VSISDKNISTQEAQQCAGPGCDKRVERRVRGRQRRFCSDDCRIRTHRISLQNAPSSVPGATALASDDLNAPAAFPAKNVHFVTSKFNHLPTPKNPRRSYRRGIQGPKAAFRTEVVHGRDWKEVISSAGVVTYVSRVTRRALVDGGAP